MGAAGNVATVETVDRQQHQLGSLPGGRLQHTRHFVPGHQFQKLAHFGPNKEELSLGVEECVLQVLEVEAYEVVVQPLVARQQVKVRLHIYDQ